MELVRSKAVCYHWRRGHCDRGNTCHFSHVGRQNKPSESTSKTTTKVAICKNGPSCDWLKKGKCSFFHHKVGVQKPWSEQGEVCQGRGQESNNKKQPKKHVTKNHNKKHNLVQPDREQCKFDGACERIPNCPFLHSLEDFPIFQGRRRPVVKKNTNQRRN